MLKEDEITRILVVDEDKKFLKAVSLTINNILSNYSDNKFNLTVVCSAKEIENQGHNFDLAFLDYKLCLNNENDNLSFLSESSKTLLVLLMDNDYQIDLKEIEKKIKKYNHTFLGDYLLKSNVNRQVFAVFCKVFIDKVLDKNNSNG